MTAKRYTADERSEVMRAVVGEKTELATPEHIWHYETTVQYWQNKHLLLERRLHQIEEERDAYRTLIDWWAVDQPTHTALDNYLSWTGQEMTPTLQHALDVIITASRKE
jgi:phytoene dehydrogenase-like protein